MISVRKTIKAAVALILILAIPASAATTLKNVSLIVKGERLTLSSSVGYVQKSHGRVMLR
jgi:hypothetical protein